MDGIKITVYSCDLNPLQNIWSILKSEVEKRHLGLVIDFKMKKS